MPLNGLFKKGADAVLGTVFDGAANIISKLKADPTKVLEYEKELETLRINAEVEMAKVAVQAEEVAAKELETVNATMREEAKSEHWAQWLWRPMIGFTFSAVLINNYILLPYLHKYGMEVITIPDNVWTSMLVILGAAAATRGWQKAEQVKK